MSGTDDASRKMDFFGLPPEIRNEIYSLLVISPEPIKICSPRSKHQIRKIPNPSNFCQLFCVNKQIYAESSMMFYAVNTFMIGNGSFGSKSLTNLHALQAFIKRVPANHLNGILSIYVEIHLRPYRPPPRWTTRYTFGTEFDAKNLQPLARAVTKHFRSLKRVEFIYNHTGPRWDEMFDAPMLSEVQVTQEWTRMFRTLFKNGSIAQIWGHDCDEVNMNAAADEILKKNPAAESIFRFGPA